MREATLIFNPLAGTLNLTSVIEHVADFWRRRGWRIHVKATSYAGHARTLAREAARARHEMVLAAGGDGTLGEIVGGLVGTDTICAPLPGGTGNSFCKELAMPLQSPLRRWGLLDACNALANGRVHRIDVGCSDSNSHWLQWTGVGLDGHIVHQIEPRARLSRKLGTIGYLLPSLVAVPKFPGMSATVEVEGGTLQGDFLAVTICNCRRYAGGQLLLNPRAVLDDGLFDIWLFPGRHPLLVYAYLLLIKTGRHLRSDAIKRISASEVIVTTARSAPVHCDGDPAGTTPLHCLVQRSALRLLAPETAPASLFINAGEALD